MPADPSERAAGLPDWFPGEARPVGVFLDYDGTLSEIAPRPEDARPVAGFATLWRGWPPRGRRPW
jgi:hypothetical protein